MTKRKTKLLVTAAITIFTLISLLVVANAATDGNIIKFIMGGKELEGEFNDYVDGEGYRHLTFETVLPILAENYAIIYDVDAPWGENVRVITDDTDPDFMDKLRQYKDARRDPDRAAEAEPEDFGIFLKDSELCEYSFSVGVLNEVGYGTQTGSFGGEFMRVGAAAGMPSAVGDEGDTLYYDYENGIKTLKMSIYYYVGKE